MTQLADDSLNPFQREDDKTESDFMKRGAFGDFKPTFKFDDFFEMPTFEMPSPDEMRTKKPNPEFNEKFEGKIIRHSYSYENDNGKEKSSRAASVLENKQGDVKEALVTYTEE